MSLFANISIYIIIPVVCIIAIGVGVHYRNKWLWNNGHFVAGEWVWNDEDKR